MAKFHVVKWLLSRVNMIQTYLTDLVWPNISGLQLLDVSWCFDVCEASIKLLTAIVWSTPHFPNLPRNRVLSCVLAALGGVLNSVCACMCMYIYDRTEPMTGTSAQPSPRNKEGWWVSPQPLLLSHTLINNHTESLPWPGGEKGEKRAHLGSSSPLMPSSWPFSKGQSVQPQLHTATFRSPLSP